MKSGKVWGNTTKILKTPFVEYHRIVVENGMKCSKHKHEHKWNAFFVENGVLEVHVFKNDYDLEDVTTLKTGDFMTIRPGEYHYFVGKTPLECPCIAFEIYYPEELSEDIVRENVGGEDIVDDHPIDVLIKENISRTASYPKDSPGWRDFAKKRGDLHNQFDSTATKDEPLAGWHADPEIYK